jgi:hypothetical protein
LTQGAPPLTPTVGLVPRLGRATGNHGCKPICNSWISQGQPGWAGTKARSSWRRSIVVTLRLKRKACHDAETGGDIGHVRRIFRCRPGMPHHASDTPGREEDRVVDLCRGRIVLPEMDGDARDRPTTARGPPGGDGEASGKGVGLGRRGGGVGGAPPGGPSAAAVGCPKRVSPCGWG